MKNIAPRTGAPVRGSATGRPIMAALDLLGRRGALRLVWELRGGRALTFRALAQAADLPPATLNARLKELRASGIVAATAGYTLTARGAALLQAIAPLSAWAKAWARASREAAR